MHHEHLMLDVIVSREQKPTDRTPVLLYVHGGGWMFGSKDFVGLLPVHFVAQIGWTVVTANYRFDECKIFPNCANRFLISFAFSFAYISL